MKTFPWIFRVLSVVVVLICVGMPVQLMVIYEYSLRDFSAALDKMTLLNWVFIGLGLIVSYHLYFVSKYLKISLPLFLLAGIVNNAYVGWVGIDFNLFQTSLASCALMALFSPLLIRKYLAVILDYRLHWWRTAPRVPFENPVQIGIAKNNFVFHAYDISTSGIYLRIDSQKNSVLANTLLNPSDQRIDLNIRLGQLHQLKCEGKIVRKLESSTQSHPAGFGIKFHNLSRANRNLIQKVLFGEVTFASS